MPNPPLYPLPPTVPDVPLAHAASHAPGGTDDLYLRQQLATVIEPFPAWAMTGNAALTSGTVYLDYFTADKTPLLANFLYENRGAVTAGITLGRMGLYTVGATTIDLVARSTASTTLGNVANTETILPFDTSTGLPATFTPTRGQAYALAVILVGATPGNMPVGGQGMNASMGTSSRGKLAGSIAGQADLPTSFSNASIAAVAAFFYLAVKT